MLNTNEINLFGNITLSDLYKEIFNSTIKRRTELKTLIEFTLEKIQEKSDIAILLPTIKELYDVDVRNDMLLEAIIENYPKLLKALNISSNNGDNNIFEELKNLTAEDLPKLEQKIEKEVNNKIENIKQKLPSNSE